MKKSTISKRGGHVLYVFSLVAFMALAVTALLRTKPSRRKESQFQPETVLYSEDELKRFWEEKMGSTLRALIINRSYRVREIQERYDESINRVEKKYGRINLVMSTSYIQASKNVFAGCDMMPDGTPSLILVMPAIVDAYKRLVTLDSRGSEPFEYLVVVAVMHELDHIAYEDGLKNHSQGVDFNDLVDSEAKAWARTCEYSIRPLVEKYGASVFASDMVYYTHWVNMGRNVDSPLWVDFIRSVYGAVRH